MSDAYPTPGCFGDGVGARGQPEGRRLRHTIDRRRILATTLHSRIDDIEDPLAMFDLAADETEVLIVLLVNDLMDDIKRNR